MTSKRLIRRHTELDVYQSGFEAAMDIFQLTRSFPNDERYALTDQVRRSSRAVCANLAEAWRKRRYEAHFVSKLSDSEAEAAETQVWLQFAVKCEYLAADTARTIYDRYEKILSMLVRMQTNASQWTIR